VHHIASVTGWAFRDILEMPIAAGMQVIDADLYSKGINRVRTRNGPAFDSLMLIDKAFEKLKKRS
jgi:hypothetical protein